MITRPTRQRVTADESLLRESLTALEMAGCQFWACKGPTLRPIPMTTCVVCQSIARLRRRLGQPIREGIEGCFPVSQANEREDLRRATSGAL